MPCNFEIEKSLLKSYSLIAGVDEAGRGPLAGPVVSAMVVLKPDLFLSDDPKYLADHPFSQLNDSKKLTKKKREFLFEVIIKEALTYQISEVSHLEIDETNILIATKTSVARAFEKITPQPDCLILDALSIESLQIPQHSFIKGDTKSYSIAAASILAKVYRDNKMFEYDRLYPEYGFAKHKGYGVKSHLAAIKQHGACPIHRKTFAPIKHIKQCL